ncbi:Protein XRI1 [Dendrobium catenatum]|uniref:Protein XRI1 n=2 Tax=Dendrobium catenatum TaxID=906689 RepID=A0A2I0WQG6_9ASPA|nr:Protein XRI1 [Dendrobium catenatum]
MLHTFTNCEQQLNKIYCRSFCAQILLGIPLRTWTSSQGPKTFDFSNPMKQFSSEEKETEQKAAIKAQKVEEEEEEIEEKSTRKKKKKKEKEKVAYPFAVLKPTELEGDLTLADINKRILRRPMRPVKHPVGEFACLPWVPDGGGGVGLSGKVVVGLTRIQTKGRGSITVIRTRG